jgi:hypothetical protein
MSTNDVHDSHAVGALLDTEITVIEIRTQAVVNKRLVTGVLNTKSHVCSPQKPID